MQLIHPLTGLLLIFEIFFLSQLQSVAKLFYINIILLIICLLIGQLSTLLSRINKLRWLFFMVFLTTAYHYNGDALFNIDYLPTYQGLLNSATNLLKLIPLIAIMVIYARFYKLPEVIGGFYTLIKYFPEKLQLIFQSLIVRLMLTLNLLETNFNQGLNWQNIIDLFNSNLNLNHMPNEVYNNLTEIKSIEQCSQTFNKSSDIIEQVIIQQYPWQLKDLLIFILLTTIVILGFCN